VIRCNQGLRGILFVFLFAFAVNALSQVATTSLRGTIKDPSAAVVPGAKITLTNHATGQEIVATSSGSGEYQFSQIPPANYTIAVTAMGFGNQAKSAELLVNQPATVNFTMTVLAISEVVNVSAEAQTINTTDASLGDSFNNATIQALPSEGRSVPELLALQPGVLFLGHDNNQTIDSRSGSVNGGRSDQGNVSIDGLDDNDQVNGYAFTGVLRETLDSVEEFRVATSNSNADSGRSSGAQISLVTKAGTNKFHGGVYEYNRPSFTVGNDWFNKEAQISEGEPNIPGKLIRNTFGAAVGGPIVKDKLFFFANYEGQRTAENTQVSRTVPTATFQQGQVIYQNTTDTINPAGFTTLMPSDIAAIDSCSATCPWGPGVDPNALNVFAKQYPAANGDALGDGGFNSGSFTFSSPSPASLNTSIVKLDYHLNDRNSFFVRGNLQKDVTAQPEQFPGLPPNQITDDNTKGVSGGWTWTITPNMVNDLRYGFVRQGFSNRGTLVGDNVAFRFLDQPVGQDRTNIVHIPVHNVVDNISWSKGKHTISGGVNWRLIFNNSDTDNNSWNSASTNEYWLANGGAIAYQGGNLDPGAFGYPAVCCGGTGATTDFSNSYNIAIALITGLVPETNGQFNYTISKDGTTGTQNADGAFVNHEYKANEFEWYLQDSWRATSKLTVTAGIRHSLLQTPYETHGQQVAPNVNTDDWFEQRGTDAARGVVSEPLLNFAPSGQARGAAPYWPMQKDNFAPRVGLAYAVNSKTAIRAGFGMYYDHFGQGVVSSFDQFGSYGLSNAISNPAGVNSTVSSPRFTGINSVPSLQSNLSLPSTLTYPYAPPPAFAITWGVDSKIHTPYSYALDLSVQQDIGKGFVFETAYVGRLGRHLLQQRDLAEPVNLVDPKSGRNYYAAGTALSKADDQGATTVATDPYWEDLFPNLATGGMSATQNIFDNFWIRGNETTSLELLDTPESISGISSPCDPANGGPGCYRFWQPQFSSLYSWASIGTSSYNAVQFILRHAFTHGLQVDASYTFSKSLDLGSDAERFSEIAATGFSAIINSFNPKLNKGVSDFNVADNITANWVYQLPVGRGQAFGPGMNRLANSLLGGWQWSGLYRWTTGLPFSVIAEGWATNWQEESGMIQTGPIVTHKHVQSNGAPQVFANPATLPFRLAYPGEAGQRNNFTGDGYFDIDSGLRKSWNITEAQQVKFAWEVFNVTNSVRFDTNPAFLSDQFGSGSLGDYSATLSEPRKMQFSLRYDF
jgi:hypothetical protein